MNERVKRLHLIKQRWIDIGLSTDTDRTKAEFWIDEVYKVIGFAPPKIKLWGGSPLNGARIARLLADLPDDASRSKIEGLMMHTSWDGGSKDIMLEPCMYGCHDAGIFARYDFFLEYKPKELECLKPLIELAKVCGWYWPFKNVVVLTPKPAMINFDAERRVHCDEGPAVKYPDGWSIYAQHGQWVRGVG